MSPVILSSDPTDSSIDDEDRLAQRFGPLELEAKWSYLVPSILCTPENSITSYCLGWCGLFPIVILPVTLFNVP